MNIVKFLAGSPAEMKGIVENNTVKRVHGSVLSQFTATEEVYPLSDITLIPPFLPRTTICADISGSYCIKSAASFSASDFFCFYKEEIVCTPYICAILKDRAGNIAATALMLSFADKNNTLSSAVKGYTRINSFNINTPEKTLQCALETKDDFIKFDFDTSIMKESIKKLKQQINFTTYDLVAFPLDKPFQTTGQNIISLTAKHYFPLTVKINNEN